jgi:hypothetical protein
MAGRPIWNMSQAGGEAMRLLFDRRRVCVTPGSRLAYVIDGASLGDPDWWPMTLRPGRHANFLAANGVLVEVPEASLASVRRFSNREKKAGRPHATEIVKVAARV